MRLQHGRVALELHELTRDDGTPLLLLHALYGSSGDWGEVPAAWDGPVYALDFSGHGRSEWMLGGAYYAEHLAGDADAALAHIGRAAIAGAGFGAYVALLLAGGRPDLVPAALLLPGAGLVGSGSVPDFTRPFPRIDPSDTTSPHDPMVRVLDFEVRPVDYADAFARAARRLILLEDADPRPPWWEAARQSPAAMITREVSSAFQLLAKAST
jgi:pimeloyl-ACP methyl ester carboxylesterase